MLYISLCISSFR